MNIRFLMKIFLYTLPFFIQCSRGVGRSLSGEYICGEKLMSTHVNAYHLT